MVIRLNGFRGKTVTSLFAKGSQWKMEAIISIKDQKGILMFNSFRSSCKPIRGHLCYKTPFSYLGMSSDSHYVAKRTSRQCSKDIYYKGVYCTIIKHVWLAPGL